MQFASLIAVKEAGGKLDRWEGKNQEISIMAYSVAVLGKGEGERGEELQIAKAFFDKLVDKSEGIWTGFKPQEVRSDEERSDELETQMLATKTARARTSVQDAPLT